MYPPGRPNEVTRAALAAMTGDTTTPRIKALQLTLERMGWMLLAAEIDLAADTLRIELRCGERLVTIDARKGRATCTREIVRHVQTRIGRRGDVTVVDRLHVDFLGRTTFEGPRHAMRWLADYIADNSDGRLAGIEARNLLRLVMDGQPHKLHLPNQR